jgi:hypothetical protein
LRLLVAAEGVLLRADLTAMEREISLELGGDLEGGDEEESAIDLAEESTDATPGDEGLVAAGKPQEFRWQVSDHASLRPLVGCYCRR